MKGSEPNKRRGGHNLYPVAILINSNITLLDHFEIFVTFKCYLVLKLKKEFIDTAENEWFRTQGRSVSENLSVEYCVCLQI